jgi:hypothetical protein
MTAIVWSTIKCGLCGESKVLDGDALLDQIQDRILHLWQRLASEYLLVKNWISKYVVLTVLVFCGVLVWPLTAAFQQDELRYTVTNFFLFPSKWLYHFAESRFDFGWEPDVWLALASVSPLAVILSAVVWSAIPIICIRIVAVVKHETIQVKYSNFWSTAFHFAIVISLVTFLWWSVVDNREPPSIEETRDWFTDLSCLPPLLAQLTAAPSMFVSDFFLESEYPSSHMHDVDLPYKIVPAVGVVIWGLAWSGLRALKQRRKARRGRAINISNW